MSQHLLRETTRLTAGADYQPYAFATAAYAGPERRRKPRIDGPFPACIYAVDGAGESFEVNTVLNDISAGGLYLRLRPIIEPGTTLFIITRLSPAAGLEALAPRVALHGVVVRAELKPDGECGVAVAFSHHRFL